MEGFIQLIEIEGKTCRVDVAGEFGVKGVMFFRQGQLWHAEFRNSHGEEAALALLGLGDPEITFTEIDEDEFDLPRTVKSSSIALLMEAARIKDEQKNE